MVNTPQVSPRLLLILCLITGLLCSCGEKEEAESSDSDPSPGLVDEKKVPTLLAEDRFNYASGRLAGNQAPRGFVGEWKRKGEGTTIVSRGGVRITASLRTSCVFDTSPDGPFADYLDENKMIGKDGTTIYISYYQELVEVQEDQVAIVEFIQGDRDVHHFTQFNTGTDTTPPPAGPFGLRAKRSIDYIVAAPEELNNRENLIVLKIRFGEQNKDRIYYYYNPSPEDEKKPDGALAVEDLSFDRYGLSCFKGAIMRVSHVRLADNFESVVADGS